METGTIVVITLATIITLLTWEEVDEKFYNEEDK